VTDANVLNSALQAAVNAGVIVVTFDSDAPASGRMAYYGVDDTQAGMEVMRQLAKVMGGQGTVAVLTGNPAAVNLSNRVKGVREAAAEFPGITIKDVYNFTPETATEAAAKMQQVQTANPDITGWALVGGWPPLHRQRPRRHLPERQGRLHGPPCPSPWTTSARARSRSSSASPTSAGARSPSR
jgi:ribose transport system substrate-binding protein